MKPAEGTRIFGNGIVRKFEDGPIWTCGYVVFDADTNEGAVVDVPMWSADKIYRYLETSGVNTRYIIATHGHWDHIGEMRKLKELTGARVCAHNSDGWMMRDPNGMLIPPPSMIEPVDIDLPVEQDMTLKVGNLEFTVIHTPGHSAGSVCLLERERGFLFTGDTLFAGSIGRTDLPSGSYDQLFESISRRLLPLPGETVILPGHGPESTLNREKSENEFVKMIVSEG